MTVSEFARACGGQLVGIDPDTVLSGFATDTSDVHPGHLFLAIKGARVDGHDFVGEALAKGAIGAVVERPTNGPSVVVADLVQALANFGKFQRAKFEGPVVGVTGSNGKTTTKEFVAAALAPLGTVLKSPANKNTEYTSPLVWAELSDQKSAVIEMAMRGPGQIAHLADMAAPTIGIVTVVGTAHIEKVGSREGIFRAKAELLERLPSTGTAIAWREDDFWSELSDVSSAPVQSFGFSQEADCRILGYRAIDWDSCEARISLGGTAVDIRIPALGRHQALNAAAALLAARAAGVDVVEAAKAMERAELPPLRLQVVEWGGAKVLLDTYNASPDSTVAAINALTEVPCEGERIAVLGEMKELGDFTESGHRMVGKALAGSSIDRVYLTGGPTRFIRDEAVMAGFPETAVTSDDQLDIAHVHDFLAGMQPGDVALVKGSRALGLERALEGLQ